MPASLKLSSSSRLIRLRLAHAVVVSYETNVRFRQACVVGPDFEAGALFLAAVGEDAADQRSGQVKAAGDLGLADCGAREPLDPVWSKYWSDRN